MGKTGKSLPKAWMVPRLVQGHADSSVPDGVELDLDPGPVIAGHHPVQFLHLPHGNARASPQGVGLQHHLRSPVHRPVQDPLRHTGPKVRAVVPLLHLPLAGQVRAL